MSFVFLPLAPKKILAITDAFRAGDYVTARQAHLEVFKLSKAMFLESNPQPIKAAMELLGLCSSTVRLPLTCCSDETLQKVEQSLKDNHLL